MQKLSLKTKVYLLSISILGLAVLIIQSFALENFPLVPFLAFASLILISEALPVYLPRGGSLSVSFTIFYAGLILFGSALGTWIAFMATFSLPSFLKKEPLYKHFFNAGQFVLSAALAGWAYSLSGGSPALRTGSISLAQDFIPLFLGGAVFLLVNTSLPTLAHALIRNIPFRNIWLMNFKNLMPNFIALAALGIILAQVYLMVGIPGLVITLIPLLITRQTFNLYARLRQAYLGVVKSLIAAIEAKDQHTKGHSERVADYAVKIARQMRLSEDKVEKIEFAALLHDLGKIGVERKVLNKPGRLTSEEFEQIQKHPVAGASILEGVSFLRESLPAVYYHHERMDGTGYLHRIKGKAIPLEARILAVADSFDAMVSSRPQRPGLDPKMAVQELVACSDSLFDEKVVKAFLAALELEHLAARPVRPKVEVG